ncbi:hypothetical protein [Lacticaseibacillus manihotivorans]|uniref:hypothetical protein n=1 Tax=Lacticaseibacillus manihotivorans TaxID=88233 RepID=UPI00138F6F78|nr:hypothetical protein [Lacticaseibacillus manihotivorans]
MAIAISTKLWALEVNQLNKFCPKFIIIILLFLSFVTNAPFMNAAILSWSAATYD